MGGAARVQRNLETRFFLKSHFARRETAIYALVLARRDVLVIDHIERPSEN